MPFNVSNISSRDISSRDKFELLTGHIIQYIKEQYPNSSINTERTDILDNTLLYWLGYHYIPDKSTIDYNSQDKNSFYIQFWPSTEQDSIDHIVNTLDKSCQAKQVTICRKDGSIRLDIPYSSIEQHLTEIHSCINKLLDDKNKYNYYQYLVTACYREKYQISNITMSFINSVMKSFYFIKEDKTQALLWKAVLTVLAPEQAALTVIDQPMMCNDINNHWPAIKVRCTNQAGNLEEIYLQSHQVMEVVDAPERLEKFLPKDQAYESILPWKLLMNVKVPGLNAPVFDSQSGFAYEMRLSEDEKKFYKSFDVSLVEGSRPSLNTDDSNVAIRSSDICGPRARKKYYYYVSEQEPLALMLTIVRLGGHPVEKQAWVHKCEYHCKQDEIGKVRNILFTLIESQLLGHLKDGYIQLAYELWKNRHAIFKGKASIPGNEFCEIFDSILEKIPESTYGAKYSNERQQIQYSLFELWLENSQLLKKEYKIACDNGEAEDTLERIEKDRNYSVEQVCRYLLLCIPDAGTPDEHIGREAALWLNYACGCSLDKPILTEPIRKGQEIDTIMHLTKVIKSLQQCNQRLEHLEQKLSEQPCQFVQSNEFDSNRSYIEIDELDSDSERRYTVDDYSAVISNISMYIKELIGIYSPKKVLVHDGHQNRNTVATSVNSNAQFFNQLNKRDNDESSLPARKQYSHST